MSKYEEGGKAFDSENYEKAMEIMLPLAQAGDVEAQLSVASMYFSGLGVQQDYRQAVKWYRPAAEKGHPVAQHSLGIALLALDDMNEAIEYLLEADKQNVSVAQSCLGDLFTGAYGSLPSEVLKKFNFTFYKALQWYQKAGKGGFPYAYHRLGNIYAKGEGVEKSEIDAIRFYHKAAEQGYSPSQRVLAKAYQDGLLGLPSDLEQAQYWFSRVQESS